MAGRAAALRMQQVAVGCYQHSAAMRFRIAGLWSRGKNNDFEYCHEICGDLHHVTSQIAIVTVGDLARVSARAFVIAG